MEYKEGDIVCINTRHYRIEKITAKTVTLTPCSIFGVKESYRDGRRPKLDDFLFIAPKIVSITEQEQERKKSEFRNIHGGAVIALENITRLARRQITPAQVEAIFQLQKLFEND